MKRKPATILLMLTAIFFTLQVSAQTSDADINSIRTTFSKINTLPLQQQKFTYEADGCVEEGKITYFLEKENILKITESGSIGDGTWTNEYYYQSGKLIFCYEVIVGGPAAGEATTTEYRYYFKNDQIIRFMEDKKIVTPNDSKVKETVQHAYGFLKAYQTKDFAGVFCN